LDLAYVFPFNPRRSFVVWMKGCRVEMLAMIVVSNSRAVTKCIIIFLNKGIPLACVMKVNGRKLCTKGVCVYYCRTYYKAVRGGGGGEWRTCAMRDDEPRPVWMSLLITH